MRTSPRHFLKMMTAAAGFTALGWNAAAGLLNNLNVVDQSESSSSLAVRPFRINFPEEALGDLSRRIAATRWPDRETVDDQSQSVQLATIQELARFWATDYDWRKCEARLNALPQFMTEMANRPQTLYGIADSPVGLAAWMLDFFAPKHGLHPSCRERLS